MRGEPDQGIGISPLERLEQYDAHPFALEAAGTIEGTFGLHIAADGGLVEERNAR